MYPATFLLMHQTIVPRDAVGRDIAVMHRVLQRHGYTSYVFGEHVDGIPTQDLIDRQAAEILVCNPHVNVIYHHSIYWENGEQVLALARGPLAIKYHNVTPPNYFAESPDIWTRCAAGREQTYRFATRFPHALWLTDSHFNLSELGLDKVLPHVVVPPFIGVAEHIAAIDEQLLTTLITDSRFQLLFVSRFVPNKGHHFLIDVLRSYVDRFGSDVLLRVVGALPNECESYYDSVATQVEHLGLTQQFRYVGVVSESDLLSYFMGSDAYLCCSEHEGFCVPIIEAQWLSLPVVARAAGAVLETAGPDQVVLGENPEEYAAALYKIKTDADHRRNLIAVGRRNFQSRFTQQAIENQFLFALSELTFTMKAFA